jgi:hypothetical protein
MARAKPRSGHHCSPIYRKRATQRDSAQRNFAEGLRKFTKG